MCRCKGFPAHPPPFSYIFYATVRFSLLPIGTSYFSSNCPWPLGHSRTMKMIYSFISYAMRHALCDFLTISYIKKSFYPSLSLLTKFLYAYLDASVILKQYLIDETYDQKTLDLLHSICLQAHRPSPGLNSQWAERFWKKSQKRNFYFLDKQHSFMDGLLRQ